MTDEHLAELWAAGKSMSEIAEALGRGESRSVVAGKIARSRARGDDRFQPRPHVGNKRLPPTAVSVPVPALGPKPRVLIDLGWNDCRMPVDQRPAPDGRHLFCGKPHVLRHACSARQERFANSKMMKATQPRRGRGGRGALRDGYPGSWREANNLLTISGDPSR
jgi:hypothetical protein